MRFQTFAFRPVRWISKGRVFS